VGKGLGKYANEDEPGFAISMLAMAIGAVGLTVRVGRDRSCWRSRSKGVYLVHGAEDCFHASHRGRHSARSRNSSMAVSWSGSEQGA